MKKIVLATSNAKKIIEMENILKNYSINVDKVPDTFNPDETGTTFEENAYIKAYEAAKLTNLPSLADDSGLVVDALDGKPGIYSSRYESTDEKRINRILNELSEYKNNERTARFVCAMALVKPDGETLFSCKGICEGIITATRSGSGGFGYDPIFHVTDKNKTMAELTLEEKNLVSHRGKALKQMLEWMKNNF
ncbi:MAG: RdgB/HAM1 family non-canonical purine NTP pyrophosphatase [bacterium]